MEENKKDYSNNVTRRLGKEAQRSNFEAVKQLADVVRTTLGPKGMDKMLINEFSDVIITNDGFKILSEMKIEHPAALMVVEVAKTQDKEVGDGTTTSVIYTSELINKASELIEKKVHPTTIISGYNEALRESLDFFKKYAIKLNEKEFKYVLNTSLKGKITDRESNYLTDLITKGLSLLKTNLKDSNLISLNNRIKILKIVSNNISESELFEGTILDKENSNLNLPNYIKNAKILFIDRALRFEEPGLDIKLEVSNVEDYQKIVEKEESFINNIITKIKESRVDVVICQKGVDNRIIYELNKEDIIVVERVRKTDMKHLSSTLNSRIISNLEDITKENIAYSEYVESKDMQGNNYYFIKGRNPKALTLILKSSTSQILEELERAIIDALGNLEVLLKNPHVVAGAGAVELELYKYLNKISEKYKGKEQLAIKAFAEAILSIPKTLAENSGFDSLDLITEGVILHNNGKKYAGIEAFNGLVKDIRKYNIYEPLLTKSQAIKSATEVTNMILRIDDILASKKQRGME